MISAAPVRQSETRQRKMRLSAKGQGSHLALMRFALPISGAFSYGWGGWCATNCKRRRQQCGVNYRRPQRWSGRILLSGQRDGWRHLPPSNVPVGVLALSGVEFSSANRKICLDNCLRCFRHYILYYIVESSYPLLPQIPSSDAPRKSSDVKTSP